MSIFGLSNYSYILIFHILLLTSIMSKMKMREEYTLNGKQVFQFQYTNFEKYVK